MCSWDIIDDLIGYTSEKYPPIDVSEGKKKHGKRLYENILIEDILTDCFNMPYNNPIDIVESYELVYEYYAKVYHAVSYKHQLMVIKKMLIFLRKRESIYG